MVHIKNFSEFVNESRGQRISLRKTNRPFDPNDNQWTQARDTRKERAHQASLDRDTHKLHALAEDFYYTVKNDLLKVFARAFSTFGKLFSINGYELCFKDPNFDEDDMSTSLCNMIPSDDNERIELMTLNGDGIKLSSTSNDVQFLLNSLTVVDRYEEGDVEDPDFYNGQLPDGWRFIRIEGQNPNSPDNIQYYNSDYGNLPTDWYWLENDCTPEIVIQIDGDIDEMPSGILDFLEHNGGAELFIEDYYFLRIDMRNVNKFIKALESYLKKY